MQITLNQDEIMNALENYVRSQINLAENQKIDIDLKAGRGENGFSATLDIVPADMPAATKAEPGVHVHKPKPVLIKDEPEQQESAPEPEVAEVDETPDESEQDVAEDEAPKKKSIFGKG